MGHRMIFKKSWLLIILLSVAGLFFITNNAKVNTLNFNYIITETSSPDSFDPLDADKTQNLTVMRMLYFSPFEVDKNNLLKSSVFEKYFYDAESNTLVLQKKKDLYFDDGSSIETQDILLSILRMAYFRPDFPMIKDIVGVKEWSLAQKGLLTMPAGIEIFDNTIKIAFRKKMQNPMFRLCLELFSIIPRKCIDLTNGKFICDRAPSSGYFRIVTNTDKEIFFERRNLVSPGAENIDVSSITFKFKKLSDMCDTSISENDVVSVNELDYLNTKCVFKNSQNHWMAASRFGILRFNTKFDLFKSADHRRYFSELVRDQINLMNLGLKSERSLMSPLLPGYIDNAAFQVGSKSLKDAFKGKKITLISAKAPVLSFIYKAIIEAAKSLEMQVEVAEKSKNDEIVNEFLENRIAIIAGASGFWAQDPVGDLSMWFTKNLHKTMTFVWNDKELYDLLHEIEEESTALKIPLKIQALNRHVYNSSIIAPLVHFRRLYITNSKIQTLNLPQAITSPAPWQIYF